MILKKVSRKIYVFFLYFFLIFPILIILFFLRIFVKINIVELETRAIGHFSLPVEIFLSEIKKKKIDDKMINCKSIGMDRYKRHIAECFKGKKNINVFMVENGQAVAYR